jgi:DNA-binding IclR family transcriptional regulator
MNDTCSPKPNRPRSSLNSGLDVLECLSRSHRSMTLTEIATALRLSKSNVHQLLATLSKRRMIERLPNQTYRIGIKAWEIGSRAPPLEISRIGAPHLAALSRETSETASIAVLDGIEMVCIQIVEAPQQVRVNAGVGDRNLAHTVSSGLAMLSELSDEDVVARLPETLEKIASGTIGDRAELLAELKRVRTRGYALNRRGWRTEVTAVATVIHGPDGRAVAGLSVPAPSYRVTREWIAKVAPALRATARRIEQDLALAVGPAADAVGGA